MLFAATWMDLESIILSEVRKRKTRKYVRKYGTNQHIYKTKTDAQITVNRWLLERRRHDMRKIGERN